MRKLEGLIAFALAVLVAVPVYGESGINSPYSRYGFGMVSDNAVGKNKAMAGMGIGMRERNVLNTLNPASYSTVDTLTFLLDIGMSLSNGNFKENGVSVNAHNASFDYLAMQFRIVRNLGFTASFMPYSNVGYLFSEKQLLRRDQDGDLTATNQYGGVGGLKVISGGLGWAPFKALSIGADFGYVYGNVTHQIKNTYSDATILTRMKTYYADLHGFKMNLGLQSAFNAFDGTFSVGAVWSPSVKFGDVGYVYDEMLDGNTSEISDTLRSYDGFSIPDKFGVGVTYSREKWMIGADVSMELWNRASVFGADGLDGRNRLKVSLGGMFQPAKNNANLFKRTAYRAGVYYNQPYFNVAGNKGPMEYGVTVGMSLPVINRWNNLIEVEVSGQYAHVHPTSPGMIEENYLRLNVGLSFNERWFAKWQVE